MVGDSVCFLAFGWAAHQATDGAGVGLVMAVGAVPRALLMLGGGVVADRYGPRRVVLGSDGVRCAVVLAVALLLWRTAPGLWPLVVGALLFGAVDALFVPAVGALPPRLTVPAQYARVQGMASLAIRLGQVAGPPLGGLAMGAGGAAAAFTVAGVLFALSLPLLYAVRLRSLAGAEGEGSAQAGSADSREDAATARRDLADGLTYLRRHPVIARLALSTALVDLALTGPLNVGLVLLAAERG
ncbi:MFS transporter, partial [Streptomyces sp. SB3404]|nr:MFS transporter [Streptomyces boncukensis]